MEELISKLDLKDFTDLFYSYLSRQKPLFMEGDTKVHYSFIKELSRYELTAPPKVSSFETYLMHLKKSGTLKLYEIYEIIKVLDYFIYLKKLNFEDILKEWIDKIIFPKEIDEIRGFFDEKGELKSSIDDELFSVDNALKRVKDDLKSSLKRVINSAKITPYLADTQIHYLNSQECLLVRGGFNHVLKASVIGRSSSGFFYVVPESVKNIKERQKALIDKKEEIKYRYEKKISSVFTKFLKFLKFIDKEFDRFDHYQARVAFAKEKELIFLLPNSKKEIIIKDFKHPALKEPKAVSVDFQKRFLFITGVNAGGKTMLLKSILSVVFLAKYLLPMRIDASRSKVGSFKHIVAILDDPQNVQNDISTFAGRMVEFKRLFSQKDALVGVDEIELGTDSDEAAVLFKSILDELIKKEIKIVITTHHKRLSSMMAKYDEVELYAALYDEKHRVPTYKFLKGTIGKSYAFETASRYGIPPNIIQNAKKLYGEEKEGLDDLIQKNIELELELKRKLKELDEKLDSVKMQEESIKEIKEKTKHQMETAISSYEKKYKELLDEVKKIAKEKSSKEIHRSLNKLHSIKKGIRYKEINENVSLKVGDSVKYGIQKGIIRSLKKDEAFVECEGVTLRVPLSKLKISHKQVKKRIKTDIKIKKPTSSSIKIDLHGLRAEDAIEKLDKFISDALITGYDEVIISHGIGSGRLSFVVKEFLKSHPKVIDFSDAPVSLGGYGATIAKL